MLSFNKNTFFYLFLFFLICDRIITLIYFGYEFTDLDQVLMWNGLWDYSNGTFHEPFFYGQAYNYMLESLLAVPLYWCNIPAYIALPTVTTTLSIIPFIAIAYFFRQQKQHYWSLIALSLPVFLPIEYNLLTTISRGFVQAHLFIPVLFYPLFYPKKEKNITILFLVAGICLVMNMSSILFVMPLIGLSFYHNYSNISFYLKSILIVPFFILDFFSKQFYELHPERNIHVMLGLELDLKTFETSILNITDHFSYLFPIFSNWGVVYLLLLILIIIYAKYKSLNKLFIFNLIILTLLLITFSIPKVQTLYANAGIFFSRSRLYLILPLLSIVNLSFFSFNAKKTHCYLLLFLLVSFFSYKNITIQNKVDSIIQHSSFPIININTLKERNNQLTTIIKENKVDIVVNSNKSDWEYMFDAYSLHSDILKNNYTSVLIKGDRRTWLYKKSMTYNTILLNGFNIEDSILNQLDYEIIGKQRILIINNNNNISFTMKKLELEFGS